MTDSTLQNPTPQFGTAEYIGSAGSDHCQYCHQPIAGAYYRANGAMTCPACAGKMRGELAKDTHAAYVRAILFGVGAAILGMILSVWIHYSGENKHRRQQSAASSQISESGTRENQAPTSRPSMLAALGTLVLLGLASPFLEFSGNPVGALIGLVILFVGMRFAWQMTAAKPMQIFGPFDNSPQLPR